MGRYSFRLPDIGEGISEAEIVAWHVKIGDVVKEDGLLADMMTDKATVEIESPVSGIVVERAGEVGDRIAIGSTLAVIEVDMDSAGSPDAQTAPLEAPAPEERPAPDAVAPETLAQSSAEPERRPVPALVPVPAPVPVPAAERAVLASPAVRARARDLGVDLRQIHAEGDRVRHADLDAFLRYNGQQGYYPPGNTLGRPDEQIRITGLRRKIAENMVASKRSIPHFSYVEEIEVTALEAMRADLNAHRGDRPKLTLLPFLIMAICRTIPQFPMINARYDDEAGVVTRHGAVHMGMATQTDAGLMVTVIRNAQDRNLWQLAGEIARLAEAARSGKAKAEDLMGGTLTISSLGSLGGIATTPVINRPEVAIIGPNRIVERPVFDGDDIRRAKLMNLSISCDHRVVDGWDAACFVQAMKRLIETPILLFDQ